ncbi:serine protease [Rhodopirellula sp. MGV]|nr:serine protease [Rhodopirellula sp. MGV]PNY36160.1 serine protease [Rhodopirellula baltica]
MLLEQLEAAESEIDADREAAKTEKAAGKSIEFSSEPGFELRLASLELRQNGIELRSVRKDETGVTHATVFVPDGKMKVFVRRIEQYAHEDSTKGKTPRPRHQDFVETISYIRRATLQSYWSDVGEFPTDTSSLRWWELWLSDVADKNVFDRFKADAEAAGLTVAADHLRFPERTVTLVRATIDRLASVTNLFDYLAEVRLAKLLAGEFLELPLSGQAEYIHDALTRISFPESNAPAVCHLDTGINRDHPLLAGAIDSTHVLTVNPNWSPADRTGHGTEMAGIALYGCLTEVLNRRDLVSLSHRLESVKILGKGATTDPALWGALTQQAASRIEIAAPNVWQRAFCLTVTAESRDGGLPSSWSAAIDQSAAAMDEDSRNRLFFVAAGNLDLDARKSYPGQNLQEGIEDPGQSWNAITVGGYTGKASIRQKAMDHWTCLAAPGSLSPSSRTSCGWSDKSWPIKPDIVMEAGNMARNPANGDPDYVDDLSLLTTRVDASGSLLTFTCDTSAATALASRFAARLWSEYPSLWTETIRALMVHSAEWTDAMLEFNSGGAKESLLRCFGYGVPRFESASRSVKNSATLIIESELQPYIKTPTRVKTHDMHFHRLPWPTAVLRDLGEKNVRMRVTLSYFIEPSPGRRGWTNKHRYQSHGLRFEVKRPTDLDEDFKKRVTAAAREEDESYKKEQDDRNWQLGRNLRCKGSIHRDIWIGIGADLAEANMIAVVPVTGWWKERPHLKSHSNKTNYSLVVTIETDEAEVDLYTPIAQAIAIANPSS